MLYPKQEECLNTLLKAYKIKKHISQHHLYLSGEMGSGKTYIASRLLGKIGGKKALVSCPATVITKWQKVYCELNNKPIDSVYIYRKKDADNLFKAYHDDNIELIVVSQNNLADLLNDLTLKECPNAFYDLKKQIINKISSHLRPLKNWYEDTGMLYTRDDVFNMTEYVSYYERLKNAFSGFDFLLFDEVHAYTPGHLDFSAMDLLFATTDLPALMLTGTLFNQNLSNLWLLLMVTNPQLCASLASERVTNIHQSLQLKELRNYTFFNTEIWRKIAVKISLNQVKKKDDLKQRIMPLKPLTLTSVQKAWLMVAQENLKALKYSKAQIDQKTTAYLDFPSKEQPTLSKIAHHCRSDYQMALALLPLNVTKTAKYQRMMEILQANPQEKAIIFVQSAKLITQLNKMIPDSFTLPASLAKNKREAYINKQFNQENKRVGIMLAKKISVGIDIRGVKNIIWYQVPDDVAQILQAQRRIMRLDSGEDSKIYFLFYGETFQEEIIKEVSQSAIHNAANYNVRDTSNLAKMTHLLFEGLGENETNAKAD